MIATSVPNLLRTWVRWGGMLGLAAGTVGAGGMELESDGADPASAGLLTNVVQLRNTAGQSGGQAFAVRLEGTVWWVSAVRHALALKDASGAELLELNWDGPPVRVGERIRLEGKGVLERSGIGCKLGTVGAVVDNDGVHGMSAKSGAAYLAAGPQPFRLEWFNGAEVSGLVVEWEGPGLPRGSIPGSALSHWVVAADGSRSLAGGVVCRCYEGVWEALPDFARLTPVKSETKHKFDLTSASRAQQVGLAFEGNLTVPREGLYRFHLTSDDGSRLFVSGPAFHLTSLGDDELPTPRPLTIGQVWGDGEEGQWGAVEGSVGLLRQEPGGWALELTAGGGRMRVRVADDQKGPPPAWNGRVRATGFCQAVHTVDGQRVAGMLWAPSRQMITPIPPPPEARDGDKAAGQMLASAREVHRLKREEAERGYPVRLRGVVTCVLPERQAFTVQDATRGLYVVDVSTNRSSPPRLGDYLELEGTTDPSYFAPIVNARVVTRLGAGYLPEPVRPSWDQLMNGSLDAQYVELLGIITVVRTNNITLLTQGGAVRVELRRLGVNPEPLSTKVNALVRLRGCLLADWDYVTHQVKAGEVRLYAADLIVEQPPPADLFAAPVKTVAELRRFDPQAGPFQRVKVAGQVLLARPAECYLSDGTSGMRFVPGEPTTLAAGAMVEVVGFPDLWGGVSPVLREAAVRVTGRAALPEPRRLAADGLLRAENDAMRMRVEGVLVSVRPGRTDWALELQSGVRTFVARLDGRVKSLPSLPVGSRLELTGVYAGQGGNLAAGRDLTSFEVLVDSPADLRVVAYPPWWTLKRLLAISAALACILAVSVLWITQLHRRVEQRTAELERQIRERERMERQQALALERARIAQDLHDELGSGITEVSMLAARAQAAAASEEKRSRCLEQVGEKARDMVTALDEIVWAMNPKHDSFASLVSYFCLYADHFLGLAGIVWRLDGPAGASDQVIDSHRRHQLFLVFKEALTNIVRHSGATEARLAFWLEEGMVRLTIADNGRGLPEGAKTEGMDGVNNMRARLERLQGRFEITGVPGHGTTLQISLPSR